MKAIGGYFELELKKNEEYHREEIKRQEDKRMNETKFNVNINKR